MSGPRTAYLNARLIDPASGLDERGKLLTEGETIADLGPGLFSDGVPDGIQAINCAGRVLAPGLIDARVFVGEPGSEHRETFASAGRAAAAGGVTTMLTMPNTDPVIDDVALVEYMARLARDSARVRVHPMAALTKGLEGREMTEFGLLSEAGAVALTDGDRAIADSRVMRRCLSYAGAFSMVVCQYPEDPILAPDGVMNEGELSMRLGLAGIPRQAETIMVERDLRLVELTGGRYHVAALSTAQSIDAVRQAKAAGLPVTAAALVHSFALNETAVGSYRTFAKTAPPLRAEEDRRAVVAGLADGTIDLVASGHDPQDVESKRLPFAQAATGIIGLETLLPLTLELYHNAELGLSRALATLTSAPAQVFGLPQGRLAPGAPGDLIEIDLDVPHQIDEDAFRSKSKNSPFGGRPVQGRVARTVIAGETVYRRAPA